MIHLNSSRVNRQCYISFRCTIQQRTSWGMDAIGEGVKRTLALMSPACGLTFPFPARLSFPEAVCSWLSSLLSRHCCMWPLSKLPGLNLHCLLDVCCYFHLVSSIFNPCLILSTSLCCAALALAANVLWTVFIELGVSLCLIYRSSPWLFFILARSFFLNFLQYFFFPFAIFNSFF